MDELHEPATLLLPAFNPAEKKNRNEITQLHKILTLGESPDAIYSRCVSIFGEKTQGAVTVQRWGVFADMFVTLR